MYKSLIDKLEKDGILSFEEYLTLIQNRETVRDYAAERACAVRDAVYGRKVYIRGLIELSSYCKNNCYYCGLRAENKDAKRYRLTKEEIIKCADEGYALGFRTFVLQGGEDAFFTDELLSGIITEIKSRHPDTAVTLSLGERSRESYRILKEAGADRYLLRHETSNPLHYSKLHPDVMSFENRQRCLNDLKELGYQVGAGFMVGSPFQSEADLANEPVYLKQLQPQMVGIGPFITHKDTPFAHCENGTAELTLFMLSLIRLTLPKVLLPATTALGTLDISGREKGLLAGANVVMPNLSPTAVRKHYSLYDNKICTGEESAQCVECLKQRVKSVGMEIIEDKGDYKYEL